MAGSGFADAALAAGSRIGRYFGLVSTIPSALFVLFVYALVQSGAWTGPPDWAAAADAVGKIDLGVVSLLLLLTLALGLIVHPLQFAMIQLLEGYWGPGRVARRAASARIAHHRAVADQYRAAYTAASGHLEVVGGADRPERIPLVVDADAFGRALSRYPIDASRVMPTRLGNVLRRFEDLAGDQYGLRVLTVGPHLGLISPHAHLSYLDDARTQLDLAVRLCVLSVFASTIAFVFLLPDGLWLLLAVVPYALAYASYRGSIVAAEDYGVALATVIDLNRFRLYEELRVPLPRDTRAERRRNLALMPLLESERWPSLAYSHVAGGSKTSLRAREQLQPPHSSLLQRVADAARLKR